MLPRRRWTPRARPCSGCGVGAAGQIHGDSGVLAVAPNLGWRNVPLGEMLRTRLGHPSGW